MDIPTTHRVLKDRRTKNLIKRLRPGDIALIHHADLDGTAARALVDCKVAAVVNAAPSITGRYPNRGPSVLLEAGIPLLDAVGEAGFAAVSDGRMAVLDGDVVRFEEGTCLQGTRLTAEEVACRMEAARRNLGVELDHFARNTLAYLDAERALLFDPIDVPRLKTRFAGRHVLVVVRGEGYKADLAMLGDYLSDVRPVLLAVDGGADALLEARLRPDVILGDMDSVSDAALRCGAELVVHGYAKGDARGAPGLERLRALGLEGTVFHAPGTSEDVAMLLADELGASLIVAVGTHFSLEDFLDKGRDGMASTFLTRLRIGSKLVDAKGIARFSSSQRRPRFRELSFMLVAAATPIIAVLCLAPAGQNLLRLLGLWFRVHFHFHGR
ncbi:MAG TPA: putative cytokinetic ring protein SteA [Chthonomonadaceae bacterium]|nr:putative cytokinetic ring protein SteA [Chthonomonadaceae bacterium]